MSTTPIAPEIIQGIMALKASKSRVFVGIDGGGGAGKTTFAAALATKLGGQIRIVHVDDFQHHADLHRPFRVGDVVYENFDFDRLTQEALGPIETQFDVESTIVIVEGIGSLGTALRGYFDYKIWLDAPIELRRLRGKNRDGAGWAHVWNDRYIPEDEQYQIEQHPQAAADFIVHML
jgi:uridine kinase